MSNLKLTHADMITHLESKGVTFEYTSKTEALEILKTKNYFFKLKCYKANFDKNANDNYKNLDFGMLVDLSNIDTRIRKFILSATLNIEHFLKAKLLKLITDDQTEDGYTIVQEFITHYNAIIDAQAVADGVPLRQYKSRKISVNSLWGYAKDSENTSTHQLYQSYGANPPIWVLLEIISFKHLVKFAEFYKSEKSANVDQSLENVINNMMFVKFIRNAAAHNSPLIRNMKHRNVYGSTNEVEQFVSSLPNVNRKDKANLKNDAINSFVTTLYVFHLLIPSKEMKEYTYIDLLDLLERIERNKKYYVRIHPEIVSIYKFVRTVSEEIIKL